MNSKRKGKLGELEFAALLRDHGYDARRGQQFAGGGDSPDVVSRALDWLHIEVKRRQKLKLNEACNQAERDCGGKPWLLAHRGNNSPWLITIRPGLFFQFLRGIVPPEFNNKANLNPKKENMKIKTNNSDFQHCPEFTGKAVCVDVTPLRKQQGQYGERNVFKIVFEVDAEKEDGSPYAVWSPNFTPTLNEKASLRKFLRGWFGRDLSAAELEDFDTETLIGKPAQVVVVHEHRDGKVYANIAACTPDRSGEPLKPSGKFVRAKDRASGVAANTAGVAANGIGAPGTSGQGGYRRAQQPAEAGSEHASVKIHVGRCKGLELRDLSADQVQVLVAKWLPTAKANAQPSADERRLIAALDWWQAEQEKQTDNVPY